MPEAECNRIKVKVSRVYMYNIYNECTTVLASTMRTVTVCLLNLSLMKLCIFWNHAERIYWTSAKFLESKQESCLQEQNSRDETKNAGENGDTLIPLFTVCKYFF